MSENNINTVTTEKDTDLAKKAFFKKLHKCFWAAIAILCILLILSTIVLFARMADFFEASKRELSLRSLIHDNKLEIFDVSYKNDDGVITVQGMDDQKVVAPGTDVEYTIRIRNVDTLPIDYELIPGVEFYSEHKIPILVRIIDPDDNYILGSPKEWVDITQMNGLENRRTLMVGECVEYVFQWKWPYEQGNDEYDTFLGSTDEKVGVKVSFTVSAVANFLVDDGEIVPVAYEDIVKASTWTTLLGIVIALLLYAWKNRNRFGIPVPPAPTPEPPAPVVKAEPVPVKAPEPRKQGFNGKMAYINLDVIQDHFESGDVVSLKILKEKGLIDPRAKQMKVLARNGFELNKALIIETQGISNEAKYIVKSAGGVVVITKG